MSEFDFSSPYVSPTGVNIFGSAMATSASDQFQKQVWSRLKSPDPTKYLVQQVTVYDVRNGQAKRGQNVGAETNSFDARFGLTLPPKVTQTELSASVTAIGYTAWANVFAPKQFAIGMGSAANMSLFTETSATSAVLSPRTYTPGADILYLGPILIGGATVAERLVVGKSGAVAAEVLSDLAATPTSAGSMNAATANLTGLLISPANAASPGAQTNLIMAGGNLSSLSQTAALGAAPTNILTGLPRGGTNLMGGIEQLQKNLPLRAFWVLPHQDLGTSGHVMNISSALPRGYIMHTNIEGGDRQDLYLGVDSVAGAVMWNRTVTTGDGVRMVSYDGQDKRDLHFLKNRKKDSDFRRGYTSIGVHGGDLYAFAVEEDLTVAVSSLGATTGHIERFIPEFDAWVATSGAWPLGTGDPINNANRVFPDGYPSWVHNSSVQLPLAHTSSHIHLFMKGSGNTVADRMLLTPEGVNPHEHYNQTGSSANIAMTYATGGTFTSNEFYIPGAGRNPTVLYEMDVSQADIAAGGTDGKLVVQWADQSKSGSSWTFTDALSAEFKGSDPQGKLYKTFPMNTAEFTSGKFRMTATQGATTTKTGNYTPITFKMITYLGGKVDKTPISVLGNLEP